MEDWHGSQVGVAPPGGEDQTTGTEPGGDGETPEVDQNLLDLLGPDGGASSAVQPSDGDE